AILSSARHRDEEKAHRIRTLVADDSPAAQQAIASLLEKDRGIYLVGNASDGREAVEKALKLHPDLVLMDLQMPKMNGLQATAELRRTLPEARIIIITVHDTSDLEQACHEAGADGFVPKHRLYRDLPTEIHSLFD
ncbi:MAG TPA: response regulator transcription factor, partial [Acidobacteriota bacterium]